PELQPLIRTTRVAGLLPAKAVTTVGPNVGPAVAFVTEESTDDPTAPNRPGRSADGAGPAARIRRHGAGDRRARRRARSARSRGHDLRQRRFGRPGPAHPDRLGTA